jgi:hypothetical protein
MLANICRGFTEERNRNMDSVSICRLSIAKGDGTSIARAWHCTYTFNRTAIVS